MGAQYQAIQFYKKQGFEYFDKHHFILGKDVQTDWLLKKHSSHKKAYSISKTP